jgi:hypothetical protein
VFDCCVDLYQSLQGFFVKTAQPIKLTHADTLYKLYWIVHSRMEISQKSTLAALSCSHPVQIVLDCTQSGWKTRRHPVEFVLDYTYGVVEKRVPKHRSHFSDLTFPFALYQKLRETEVRTRSFTQIFDPTRTLSE